MANGGGGTTKTTLEVEAKPKGFAKLRDEAGGLNKAIKDGQAQQKRGFDDLAKKTTSFADSMERAMRAVGKNRQALGALREVAQHFDALDKKITQVEQSLKRADQARGAFFQGLAQGMGAGEFLQRGPGMQRQVAGRMIGRAAAAPARMFAGGMFGGVGGLAQGLGGIPIIGGALAGLMGNAMGFAGGALDLQRQRLQVAPMIGGVGLAQQMASIRVNAMPTERIEQMADAARAEAITKAWRGLEGQNLARAASERVAREAQKDAVRRSGGILGFSNVGMRRMAGQATAEDIQQEGFRQAIDAGEAAAQGARAPLMARRQAELARARRARDALFAPIRRAGARFGMAEPEALQMAGQLGPGVSQNMLQTAMAAQRMGVGVDLSAAFQRAGRRGGMVGAAGAEGLTQAMGDAMRMGLEGSEVPEFLRIVAEGIQRFEQTGIPINAGSIAGIGRATAGMGLGGIRGAAFGRQLSAGGQRIGRTGPTGAVDVLALQTLGGFKGGGSEAILQAMERMEEGTFDPQGLNQFIKSVSGTAGPGAFGQGRAVRMALERIGVSVGSREARLLSTQAMGGQLSPEQRAVVDKEQARILAGGKGAAAVDTPKSIQELASAMVTDFAPGVKRQADLQNRQLKQGEQLISTMQNLQSATSAMAAAFTVALGPTLKELTTGIDKSAKTTEDFVRTMKKEGVMAALTKTWNT